MERRFQQRRFDGRQQRMRTQTYQIVHADIPVLERGVVEIVGFELHGSLLCCINDCDTEFFLLSVSVFEELQDTIIRMKETIDNLQRELETTSHAFEARDAKLENKMLENEHLSAQITSMSEELSSTALTLEAAKKESIQTQELVASLRTLESDIHQLALLRQQEASTKEKKLLDAPRQYQKNWNQLKRLLHDIKRVPRRRKKNQSKESISETGRRLKQRRCYKCRCKGHEASECPQLEICESRTQTITLSAEELQQKAEWYRRVTEAGPAQFVICNGNVIMRFLPPDSDKD